MRSPQKEQELTQLQNVSVVALDVQNHKFHKSAVQKGIEIWKN